MDYLILASFTVCVILGIASVAMMFQWYNKDRATPKIQEPKQAPHRQVTHYSVSKNNRHFMEKKKHSRICPLSPIKEHPRRSWLKW